MKKKFLKVAVIMISSVVFSSCGTSTEELNKQVQESVEENWGNQGITNVQINDLTLIVPMKIMVEPKIKGFPNH